MILLRVFSLYSSVFFSFLSFSDLVAISLVLSTLKACCSPGRDLGIIFAEPRVSSWGFLVFL